MIRRSNGVVAERQLIADDARVLKYTVSRALERADLDVVLLTGGTGVSTTDVTIESVRPFFEKEIEGFGEVFARSASRRLGQLPALSRATAGRCEG